MLNPSPQELAVRYIRFFELDVFVESDQGQAKTIGINSEDIDYRHPRVVQLEAFFTAGDTYQKDTPFGTDIFDIYQELYERDFKFVSRHERRVAIF